MAGNEQQLYVWGGGNADIFMWPRHDMPAEPNEPFSGTLYATWYASGGTAGKAPEDPELLKAYDMLRKGCRPGDRRAEQARPGAQEADRRSAVGDRDRRLLPGPAGHRQQDGQRAGSVRLGHPGPDPGRGPSADVLLQELTEGSR